MIVTVLTFVCFFILVPAGAEQAHHTPAIHQAPHTSVNFPARPGTEQAHRTPAIHQAPHMSVNVPARPVAVHSAAAAVATPPAISTSKRTVATSPVPLTVMKSTSKNSVSSASSSLTNRPADNSDPFSMIAKPVVFAFTPPPPVASNSIDGPSKPTDGGSPSHLVPQLIINRSLDETSYNSDKERFYHPAKTPWIPRTAVQVIPRINPIMRPNRPLVPLYFGKSAPEFEEGLGLEMKSRIDRLPVAFEKNYQRSLLEIGTKLKTMLGIPVELTDLRISRFDEINSGFRIAGEVGNASFTATLDLDYPAATIVELD